MTSYLTVVEHIQPSILNIVIPKKPKYLKKLKTLGQLYKSFVKYCGL